MLQYSKSASQAFYYDLLVESNLESEHVVDEIISSEKDYCATLLTFYTTYTEELQSIATGEIGSEPKKSLGLTAVQVQKFPF